MILSYYYFSDDAATASKIELHYYFNDKSHSIDAYVKNNCEAEFLGIVKEVTSWFDIDVEVETEPYKNGGFKQILKFSKKNAASIGILLSIITMVLTRLPTPTADAPPAIKKHWELQNIKDSLQIELLKRQMNKNGNAEYVSNNHLNKTINHIVIQSEANPEIVNRRSRFFTQINNYQKVTHISTTILNDYNKPVRDTTITVDREDFRKYIVPSDSTSTHHNE